MTVLASLAYQDSDLILEEMGRGSTNESLDEAVQRIADYTGDDPYEIRNIVLFRLSEYVANSFDDAREALRWLGGLDHEIGVWAACQVAREALRFVPEGEQRPRIAIEVTEAWVRRKASLAKAMKARDAAYAASSYASDAAAYAAYAADAATSAATSAYSAYAASAAAANAAADANTAYATAYAASAAAGAASAASVADTYSEQWYAVRDAELQRLVGVVADAIMSFPVTA